MKTRQTLKLILSNWITVLGIYVGAFFYVFIDAVYLTLSGSRGLTFETVVVETIFGSLVYGVAILQMTLKPFLAFILLIIVFDVIIQQFGIKNFKKCIIVETVILTSILVVYALGEETGEILIFVPFFICSQYLRYRLFMKGMIKENLGDAKMKRTFVALNIILLVSAFLFYVFLFFSRIVQHILYGYSIASLETNEDVVYEANVRLAPVLKSMFYLCAVFAIACLLFNLYAYIVKVSIGRDRRHYSLIVSVFILLSLIGILVAGFGAAAGAGIAGGM